MRRPSARSRRAEIRALSTRLSVPFSGLTHCAISPASADASATRNKCIAEMSGDTPLASSEECWVSESENALRVEHKLVRCCRDERGCGPVFRSGDADMKASLVNARRRVSAISVSSSSVSTLSPDRRRRRVVTIFA